MKAAQATQGQDAAGTEQRRSLFESGFTVHPVRAAGGFVPDPGTAGRAAVGLRVVAPVGGVPILPQALVALPKRPHAGALPIVRQRLDDGEARAAVGTGDEGKPVPAVARVEQLGLAGGAETRVGRDRLALTGSRATAADAEARGASGNRGDAFDFLDPGKRRRLATQRPQEGRQLPLRALHFDLHLSRLVPDPTREPMPQGEPVDERAETHSLHHARDVNPTRTQAGTHARTCSLRNSYHESMPSPVVAEVKKKRSPGLTSRAFSTARVRSNLRCGRRSILLSTA